MRIVTWNVNGIKTLPHYHPWNKYKTLNDILNSEEMSCDIVCMQEMKMPRSALPQTVALPDSFHAFLSFPSACHEGGASQAQKKIKAGYSGSGVYTRREGTMCCTPLLAESLLCFPPREVSERISPNDESYPGLMPFIPPLPSHPEEGASENDSDAGDSVQEDSSPSALDSEGRSVILDFGLFVLVNVYCPNDGSGRSSYKRAYHAALQARVTALIKEGREVMVVGDLNAVPYPIDHCEGALDVKREGLDKWYQGPSNSFARAWLRDWLVPLPLSDSDPSQTEKLVDIVRVFHPDRKAMYTCWNTLLSARESNYGTRIDFILVSRGLVPWIKHADIMADLRGSDHCPVYVDFHDSITIPSEDSGAKEVHFKDVFGKQASSDGSAIEPPALATRWWDEYSGKQMRLDRFFGGGGKKKSTSTAPTPPIKKEQTQEARPSPGKKRKLSHGSKDAVAPSPSPSSVSKEGQETQLPASSPLVQPSASPSTSSSEPSESKPKKPALQRQSSLGKSKKAKPSSSKSGETPKQQTIASFFSKPPQNNGKGKAKATEDSPSSTPIAADVEMDETEPVSTPDHDIDADYEYAVQLSQAEPVPSSSQGAGNEKSKEAWTKLLKPPEAPNCPVHGEPCKKMIVNKKGPNKGRAFWICSRPVGPGYDKGKGSRPRDEVDHQWKCDFFKWCSDRK